MELPPLWMFYVIPGFSCTYLFFYQDCKLLKVQHCTHLPFGNDSDLLRKKKFFFEKSHGLIGCLALSTHCGKCFWQTWLNDGPEVWSGAVSLYLCTLRLPISTGWMVLVISSLCCLLFLPLCTKCSPDPKLRGPWWGPSEGALA